MDIIERDVLAEEKDARITRLVVSAPLIAAKALAGQFVVLMAKEEGERIPLTVVDKDEASGSITLIVQEIGLTTKLIGRLKPGDSLYALAGPLGHATNIRNYGRVVLIGGGVGIAEIYPVAKALKDAGNYITTILGARAKALLILEDELKAVSDDIFITTDDGSYGRKGFTTDILKGLLAGNDDTCGLVYAVGPIPMMEKASSVTMAFGTRTLVSLNSLMIDATGMCGVCRVKINNEVRFTCIDGPEFDAHQVDWEELKARGAVYRDKEKHMCNLYRL